jgi:glycerophosphoryl diester phosphodiesterase
MNFSDLKIFRIIIYLTGQLYFFTTRYIKKYIPNDKNKSWKKRSNLKIIGHRGFGANRFHSGEIRLPSGARVNCTENTLDAFKLAAEQGLWGIEFDLRLTADEKIVIHHDPFLDGNPELQIESLSHKEIQSISRKSIPLYDELLDLDLGILLFAELKRVDNSDKYLDLIASIVKKKLDENCSEKDNLQNDLSQDTLSPKVSHQKNHIGNNLIDLMFHFISFEMSYLVRLKKILSNLEIKNIEFLFIARYFRYLDFNSVLSSGLDGVLGHYTLADRRRVKYLKDKGLKSGLGIINNIRILEKISKYKTEYFFSDNFKLI